MTLISFYCNITVITINVPIIISSIKKGRLLEKNDTDGYNYKRCTANKY